MDRSLNDHSDGEYDFTMCNPPFYASREEVIQSAEAKEFEPNAVCGLQCADLVRLLTIMCGRCVLVRT